MPVIDKTELGKRLAHLPALLGLNSRQIATAIGADPSYYSRAEKGRGLSLTYIDALIEKFSLSKNWLILGEGEPVRLNSPETGNKLSPTDSPPEKEAGAVSMIDPIAGLPVSDAEKLVLYREKLALLQNEVAFWKRIAMAKQHIASDKNDQSE